MTAWWTQLVTGAPASARATLEAPGVADRMIGELAAAHARWPEATVSDAAFAGALVTQLTAQKDPVSALARLRIEDLFLARWCATGDARAIAAFERVHRGDLEAVLARFRRLGVTDDELRQILRIKLFVASGERSARIGEYSGFGFLQNWVRVTALRAMLDIARSERTRKLEELLADDDLLGVPSLGASVDNRYTREQLSRAIKQAFARAVTNLAPRQRNFLRHAHVDQLTLDQIAALYTIHRATVARTLAQARGELMTATRSALGELLGLPDDQLDSIVRSADSRIDLSLSRVLRAPALAEGSDDEP